MLEYMVHPYEHCNRDQKWMHYNTKSIHGIGAPGMRIEKQRMYFDIVCKGLLKSELFQCTPQATILNRQLLAVENENSWKDLVEGSGMCMKHPHLP